MLFLNFYTGLPHFMSLCLIADNFVSVIVLLILTPGTCVHGSLRIISTRLEYCYNDQWGTVCDDFWDFFPANPQVACRHLGLRSSGNSFAISHLSGFKSCFL